MNVSSRKLAVGLARVLDEVSPAGLSVRAAGVSLAVYSGGVIVGSSAALEILDDADGSGFTAGIETATRAALSGVQDVIIEDIHDPWPATPPAARTFRSLIAALKARNCSPGSAPRRLPRSLSPRSG